MNSSARIRRLCASEVETIRQLIHHTIDVSYTPVYPPRAVRFFKNFHSRGKILERHRKGEILVVELEGKAVGSGSIVDADILGVFIHPDFQRRGLGRTLMGELEMKAMANGIGEVVLSVSLPARNFYERLGYEIGEDLATDVGAGQRLCYWEARKTLSAVGFWPVPA